MSGLRALLKDGEAVADEVSVNGTAPGDGLEHFWVSAAYDVLSERDWEAQQRLIVSQLARLLRPSAVHVYERDAVGEMRLRSDSADPALPGLAVEMERELLPRSVEQGRSLLSTHPMLDEQLRGLADACSRNRITTHVELVKSEGVVYGAFAIHWIGRERPGFERRSAAWSYWATVGRAVAASRKLAQLDAELVMLRERAYKDQLTGLPNRFALEEQFIAHEQTVPLSILAIDFDGMRDANTVFGSYKEGGDVLIKAVADGLSGMMVGEELLARLHTAGDEFAVLLPFIEGPAVARRAKEIEHALDTLAVPATHRHVYRGASVGSATRLAAETATDALERAVEDMRTRKKERRGE